MSSSSPLMQSVREFAALRALRIEFGHAKLMRALGAALHARNIFQVQHHRLPFRVFHQDLEAKLQRIPVNAGQFPDFNAYFGDAAVGMALGFCLHGFENGSSDA